MRLRMVVLLILFAVHANRSDAQSYQVKSFDEVTTLLANTNDTTYVISFWATWCKPCVAELPHLEKLNTEFPALRVILISLDGENYWNTSLQKFIKKNNMNSEVWVMQQSKPTDWIDRIDPRWQGSIPATMFLNNSKGIKLFEEHEFTYDQLVEIIRSIELNNN